MDLTGLYTDVLSGRTAPVSEATFSSRSSIPCGGHGFTLLSDGEEFCRSNQENAAEIITKVGWEKETG